MKWKLPLLASLTLLGWVFAGAVTAVAATATWVVEFEERPAAHWLAEQGLTVHDVDPAALDSVRADLRATQDAFLESLAESGIPAQVVAVTVTDEDGLEVHEVEFRYTLVYNGLTLQMDKEWVETVRELPQVREVHPESVFFTLADFSVDYIRAPEVYGALPALSPFDELSDGLEGQGVIVSVIDTGIDWTHEMFGADASPPRLGLAPHTAALGSNEKVIYQLPLTGTVGDDFGHGTHVAATAAGYLGFAPSALIDDESPVHGVAPQGRLMDYKVCTAAGSCLGSAIIMAIEDSVSPRTLTGFPKPVAHVINMSLGGAGGPDSPNAIASDNAALAGTIVVSSAGNSGPQKSTIGQPSAGRHVISVGANHDPGPPIGTTDDMAAFSSRGPVRGMGQIKPDVTAPGVSILAATSPVGLMSSPTRYIRVSGTSMSGPHVAGVAALVRQARHGWTPDLVRTALINTSTNLRDMDGHPRPDGLQANDILSQGGGLVDVARAINVPALMGVVGDGINAPGLLGSHSFGEVPVVDSRVTHSESVDVSIVDVTDEAGDWGLAVVNNRDLQFDGIDVGLSTEQVHVPAGGSAEFTVNIDFDGDALREPFETVDSRTGQTVAMFDTQWYVIATRAGDEQHIRMPFHMRPINSVPSSTTAVEEVFTGILLASDTGLDLIEGVTFEDFPFEVAPQTFRLQGDLVFPQIVDGTYPDLDLFLLDPDGEQIASSTNPGGPEHIAVNIDRPGTYTWRVGGWASAVTEYELTSIQHLGGGAPTLLPIKGDVIGVDDVPVSVDGSYELKWDGDDDALAYEIERATGSDDFEVIAEIDGSTTAILLSDQPAGLNQYRVRMLIDGEIGFFVTDPSNIESILVDYREQVEITEVVKTVISNVDLTDGVFSLDMALTNESDETWLPRVDLFVVGINSASGTQRVINADNAGSGTSPEDPAQFDYSGELGDDGQFNPGETTGARHLRFSNEAQELFTFDVMVTAFERTGEPGSSDSRGRSGKVRSAGGNRGGVERGSAVLRFEVNPLTGTVTVKLVSLLETVDGLI